MSKTENDLAMVPPSERILLLSHCLRRADTCQGKYDKFGLQCVECNPECPVNHLRSVAIRLGYKGICVAPGGRLAVKYVSQMMPKAIVAVACQKELEEGVDGVKKLADDHQSSFSPVIVIIPLTKDGCVDTEVDEAQAIQMLELGYASQPV